MKQNRKVFVLANGKTVIEKRSKAPLVAVLLIIAAVVSGKVTGFDFYVLVTRISYFFVMIGDMFPPDWGYMSAVWTPLLDTIKMSLLYLRLCSQAPIS